MKQSKILGLSAFALAAVMVAGCGGDVAQGVTCGDQTCGENQKCDEATMTCVDTGSTGTCSENRTECSGSCVNLKEDSNNCGKCGNVCEDGKTCKDGSCEAAGEQGIQCSGDEYNCNEKCVSLLTDKENCGNCGTVCSESEICSNGQCIAENANLCDDSEAATCEGNSVKKCADGQYSLQDCGDLSCVDGECKSKEADVECDVAIGAFCDGNVVKKCVDGKYVDEDCGSQTCDSGECKSGVVAECQSSEPAICVGERNAVRTCKDGRWDYQDCGTQVCQENKCVDVTNECEDSEAAVCEENGLKKCVEGKYVTEPCGDGMICKEDQCVKTALEDLCPDDPDKKGPGVCGCGIADVDMDNNGTVDCQEAGDLCPDDPDKTLPGICGCNIPDTIDEKSGNPVCLDAGIDLCPTDSNKTLPGICGCNVPDTIDELNRVPMCGGVSMIGTPYDMCIKNDGKYLHGVCGCAATDEIGDQGVPACALAAETDDLCPDDENKDRPGICGCGVEDSGDNILDSDGDGVADCIDHCPANPYKFMADSCTCEQVRVKIDGYEYCATPISTAAEFIKLKNDINNGIGNSVNDVYAIMKDINLIDVIPSGIANEWVGITNFKGKMVSAGKTIKLSKGDNQVGTLNCTGSYCGLFATLSGARIHNINVEMNVKGKGGNIGVLAGSVASSVITSVNSVGDADGAGNYVGGLIGYGSATTLGNVSHKGTIKNTGSYSGGIVGRLQTNSSITSAASEGNVTGASYTGGVVGSAEGSKMIDVSSDGDIVGTTNVGGIAGASSSPLTTAVVKGSVKGGRSVGGICGSQSGDITDAKNYADVTGERDDGCAGQIAGVAPSMTGHAKEIYNFGNVNALSTTSCPDTEQTKDVGGIFSSYSGGYDIIDVHNYGNVKTVKPGQTVGGICGRYGGAGAVKNVSNHGNVEGGTWFAGGIMGMFQNGLKTTKSSDFENVVNEGNVAGYSQTGGIIGYVLNNGEDSAITFKQVMNKGTISSTANYVGGILGYLSSHANCTMNNVFSTGAISGQNYVGGLIGLISESTTNTSSQTLQASKAREVEVLINGAYSTGEITGKGSGSYTGGLIGYIDTISYNRSVKQAKTTIKCPSDETKTTTQAEHYQYYDIGKIVKIMNAYSTGNVTGTGATGGLIGRISSDNVKPTYKNVKVSYDSSCNVVKEDVDVHTAIRGGQIIISNVFASGKVTGTTNHVGGLIGMYGYTNNTIGKYRHSVNNAYATGSVSDQGGGIVGYRSLDTTYKNTYYWPKAGAGLPGVTSCTQCGGAYSDPGNMAGVMAFEYENAVPMITEYGVKLLDQLNSNIVSSSASELNSNVSLSWIEYEQTLINNLKVKIPKLDLEPAVTVPNLEDDGRN